jgi:hypothetical protein
MPHLSLTADHNDENLIAMTARPCVRAPSVPPNAETLL